MLRALSKSRGLCAATVLCALRVATGTAFADLIVLRSGTEILGSVVNREKVASNPGSFTQVEILVEKDAGSKLYRVDTVNIDYIVLQDATEKRLIEFSPIRVSETPPASPTAADSLRARQLQSRITSGVVVAGLGAGFGILGVVQNDALLIGGVALFFIGVTVAATAAANRHATGLQVSTRSGFGLCYRVTY